MAGSGGPLMIAGPLAPFINFPTVDVGRLSSTSALAATGDVVSPQEISIRHGDLSISFRPSGSGIQVFLYTSGARVSAAALGNFLQRLDTQARDLLPRHLRKTSRLDVEYLQTGSINVVVIPAGDGIESSAQKSAKSAKVSAYAAVAMVFVGLGQLMLPLIQREDVCTIRPVHRASAQLLEKGVEAMVLYCPDGRYFVLDQHWAQEVRKGELPKATGIPSSANETILPAGIEIPELITEVRPLPEGPVFTGFVWDGRIEFDGLPWTSVPINDRRQGGPPIENGARYQFDGVLIYNPQRVPVSLDVTQSIKLG